jgi:hypothetical protein
LENVESLARGEPPDYRHDELEFRLKVAREKKEDCILWGKMLQSILDTPVDGSNLEAWFCLIGERIANDKNMHRGTSSTLNGVFTDLQQRVLSCLFWEVFSEHASHNRERRALASISRGTNRRGGAI